MDEKDPYQRSLKTRYFLKLDDSEDIANIAAANLRYADDRKHRMLKEVCDEEQRSIRTNVWGLLKTFLASFFIVVVIPLICLTLLARSGFRIYTHFFPNWVSPRIKAANSMT
mmetsp:Transcript_43145/g.69517  ORF Transcript_43145/g.69517 Transcript_43145/m.69517 type:complete len:112 (-) Transcript_43145:75-410(-)